MHQSCHHFADKLDFESKVNSLSLQRLGSNYYIYQIHDLHSIFQIPLLKSSNRIQRTTEFQKSMMTIITCRKNKITIMDLKIEKTSHSQEQALIMIIVYYAVFGKENSLFLAFGIHKSPFSTQSHKSMKMKSFF